MRYQEIHCWYNSTRVFLKATGKSRTSCLLRKATLIALICVALLCACSTPEASSAKFEESVEPLPKSVAAKSSSQDQEGIDFSQLGSVDEVINALLQSNDRSLKEVYKAAQAISAEGIPDLKSALWQSAKSSEASGKGADRIALAIGFIGGDEGSRVLIDFFENSAVGDISQSSNQTSLLMRALNGLGLAASPDGCHSSKYIRYIILNSIEHDNWPYRWYYKNKKDTYRVFVVEAIHSLGYSDSPEDVFFLKWLEQYFKDAWRAGKISPQLNKEYMSVVTGARAKILLRNTVGRKAYYTNTFDILNGYFDAWSRADYPRNHRYSEVGGAEQDWNINVFEEASRRLSNEGFINSYGELVEIVASTQHPSAESFLVDYFKSRFTGSIDEIKLLIMERTLNSIGIHWFRSATDFNSPIPQYLNIVVSSCNIEDLSLEWRSEELSDTDLMIRLNRQAMRTINMLPTKSASTKLEKIASEKEHCVANNHLYFSELLVEINKNPQTKANTPSFTFNLGILMHNPRFLFSIDGTAGKRGSK
ncbi:MAG: hypothetical protein M5R36_11240 [Deltaproteobacteria bacterium]|nr:hypothetical protein [Deltaproteobacteria bacterium]